MRSSIRRAPDIGLTNINGLSRPNGLILINGRLADSAIRNGMTQEPPKPSIFFFSRGGHSRRLAEELGARLGVSPVEVKTSRYTWPVLGWIAAGRDGMRGAAAPLEHAPDMPEAGLVILVGPVWAGGVASPLNSLVAVLKSGIQEVAIALTCMDPKEDPSPVQKAEHRLGRPLRASLVLSNAAQGTPAAAPRIAGFLQACLGEDGLP
jgi:hypothetical protein